MFETMFGAEMPLAVRFILAFLIVLGLIGVTAWAVRRFGSGRLGGASARGRQPRLGVIDHATVDARRRLILIRRDNVEHLLMIGGPTDIVVESNIVRAATPGTREAPTARPPTAIEPLPRAIPLPENGHGSWPLQPEPASSRPAPRFEPTHEEPATNWSLQPHGEVAKRPQRDTLAALADELSTRQSRPRTPAAPRPQPQVQPVEAPQTEPRTESRPQPAQAEPVDAAVTDQSLAEMAHRLEAALRKPSAMATEPRSARAAAPAIEPTAPPPPPPPPSPPRAARPAEPKPARAEAKPSQGKTLYDSLEQEMASLLGRPTNKN